MSQKVWKDLKDWLTKNNLNDSLVYDKLKQVGITLEIMLHVDASDIRDLCKELKLPAATRLKLVAALKRSEKSQPPNGVDENFLEENQQENKTVRINEQIEKKEDVYLDQNNRQVEFDHSSDSPILHPLQEEINPNPVNHSNQPTEEPQAQDDIEFAYRLQMAEIEEEKKRKAQFGNNVWSDQMIRQFQRREDIEKLGMTRSQIDQLFGNTPMRTVTHTTGRLEEIPLALREEENQSSAPMIMDHEREDENVNNDVSSLDEVHSPTASLPFSDMASFSGKKCSICLQIYSENDQVKMIPACGCHFHIQCIDPWINMKYKNYSKKPIDCPLHKSPVFP